jgi:hypothetical protein
VARRASQEGKSAAAHTSRWLLLIHQIPPKPDYFRAKVRQRLLRLGSVAVKNSVYILPLNDGTQEDLQWVAREIVAEGGDATLCTASFVEGLRDEQIEALFHTARDADYARIAEDARDVARSTPRRARPKDAHRPALEADIGRLRKRLSEVLAIDFFGASGREAAEATIASLEKRLVTAGRPSVAAKPALADYRKRLWVTRQNVHVDRIASAWLIKRFIDPEATFAFVPAQGHRPRSAEVTFDMFEATFTHVGDRCTFEVLVDAFDLKDHGLRPLAEIVHDIDVKDGKFGRAEAPGIAALVAAIAVSRRDDAARIELGSTCLDALLDMYRRKKNA